MVYNDAAYAIRVAGPGDTDAVSALLVASYSSLLPVRYDSEVLRLALPPLIRATPTLLVSGSTFYVAEREAGELIGCGGWTIARPGSGETVAGEAHLRWFAIHPDGTRRRIGTALLRHCFSDAQRLGIGIMHCFSSLTAEPFYRASGFDVVGPLDVPIGDSLTFTGVLMRCKLQRRED